MLSWWPYLILFSLVFIFFLEGHEIAEKTLLVGLGSTSFRSARYSSHEVRSLARAMQDWLEYQTNPSCLTMRAIRPTSCCSTCSPTHVNLLIRTWFCSAETEKDNSTSSLFVGAAGDDRRRTAAMVCPDLNKYACWRDKTENLRHKSQFSAGVRSCTLQTCRCPELVIIKICSASNTCCWKFEMFWSKGRNHPDASSIWWMASLRVHPCPNSGVCFARASGLPIAHESTTPWCSDLQCSFRINAFPTQM